VNGDRDENRVSDYRVGAKGQQHRAYAPRCCYEGVELFQRPEVLGDIDKLLRLLREYGLTLIGLTGGSLRERMEFCGDFRPEYLYIDSWDREEALLAMRRGFTLGIHPHVYMPIQRLADARELLEQYYELRFNLDTAHLTIAGEDPVRAIDVLWDRIVAVHLKDWSPEFGRSAHRYARGFVELGTGSVDLHGVMEALKKKRYDRWIVIEQDYSPADAVRSTRAGIAWVAERLGRSATLSNLVGEIPLNRNVTEIGMPPARDTGFVEAALSAGWQDIGTCYQSITKAVLEACGCDLVTLWTCSASQDAMVLVAAAANKNEGLQLTTRSCERRAILSGQTIDRRAVTHFDLTRREGWEHLEQPELLGVSGFKTMTSLPVFNPLDFNHVKLVLNILARGDAPRVSDEEFLQWGEYIGLATATSLDSLCSKTAARVNLEASKCRTTREFADSVARLIHGVLQCKGVGVFLLNDLGNKLELAAGFPKTTWAVPEGERFYRKGEGLTGQVWERDETLLAVNTRSVQGWKGKSFEGDLPTAEDACLFVPLTKLPDKLLGVIRCRGGSARWSFEGSHAASFSDDDAAVVEAVGQASIPYVELLLNQERREKALGRLTHELKVPLVAIRGATELIMRTPGVTKALAHDYPGDIWSWSELMGRLIDNADAARYSVGRRAANVLLIRILPEVIAPVLTQARFLLEERGFSARHISYRGFDGFPKLYLDRNRFQQVVFNLLSNSIKYAYKDPDAFRVDMEGGVSEREYVIWFRDWGLGIEPRAEERIFEEGYRGQRATETNVTGQGLGLWIARMVVEMHSGHIEITSSHHPTEFRISLPDWLASRPPSQREL
jgi:signal transduction histidine kinase/sugar phosphate isomerase/epimerase